MPVESSLPDFYFHSISLSPEPTLLHVTMPHLLFCVRGYLNYWANIGGSLIRSLKDKDATALSKNGIDADSQC